TQCKQALRLRGFGSDRMCRPSLLLSLSPLLPSFAALAAFGDEIPPAVARRVDFDGEVRPILTARCLACHGPDKQKGSLRLDRKSDAFKGGDEGDAIVPGKGIESLIVRLTAGEDEDRVMPPKGGRLTVAQVAILR